MPTSIPDLAWYVSTGIIALLISIIILMLKWGVNMLLKKIDEVKSEMVKWVEHVLILERRFDKREALCEERHRKIEAVISQGP